MHTFDLKACIANCISGTANIIVYYITNIFGLRYKEKNFFQYIFLLTPRNQSVIVKPFFIYEVLFADIFDETNIYGDVTVKFFISKLI